MGAGGERGRHAGSHAAEPLPARGSPARAAGRPRFPPAPALGSGDAEVAWPGRGWAGTGRPVQPGGGCSFQSHLEKSGTETLKCETARGAAFCWHRALEVGPTPRGAGREEGGGHRQNPLLSSQQALTRQTTDLKPQPSGFSGAAVCPRRELPAARSQAGRWARAQPFPRAGDGRAGKAASKIHGGFPSPSGYQRGLKALEKDGSGTRPRAPATRRLNCLTFYRFTVCVQPVGAWPCPGNAPSLPAGLTPPFRADRSGGKRHGPSEEPCPTRDPSP